MAHRLESQEHLVDLIGFGRFQMCTVAACGAVTAAQPVLLTAVIVFSDILRCQWHLSAVETLALPMALLAGVAAGTPLFGALSLRLGRRDLLFVCGLAVVYAVLLAAFSVAFWWLLTVLAYLGLLVGGVAATGLLLATDHVPRKWRPHSLILLFLVWSAANLAAVGLAAAFNTDAVVRMYLCAVGAGILAAVAPVAWLLESPHHLLAAGRPDQATDNLRRVARANGRSHQLVSVWAASVSAGDGAAAGGGGGVWRISKRDIGVSVWGLIFIWCAVGLNYTASFFYVIELARFDVTCRPQVSFLKSFLFHEHPSHSCCDHISSTALATFAFACSGEIFGAGINLFLFSCLGRRYSVIAMALVTAFIHACLNVCSLYHVLPLLVFLLRTTSSALFVAVHSYTVEILPTALRPQGQLLCTAVANTGAVLAPLLVLYSPTFFWEQVGLLLLSCLCAVVAAVGICLPMTPLPDGDANADDSNRQLLSDAAREGTAKSPDNAQYATFPAADSTSEKPRRRAVTFKE